MRFLIFLIFITTPAFAQLEEGKRFFINACSACHANERGASPRQGPNLIGIFGKKSGQIEDFKYSDPLKNANLTYDEPTLDKWLINAQALVPGTTMNYRQNNPERRKAIIDYLKSLQ